MLRLHSLIGLISLILLSIVFSEDKKHIPIRIVVVGLLLQLFFGFILLKLPQSRHLFYYLTKGVQAIEESTKAGTSFVFGYLGGGPLPFKEKIAGTAYILAFQTLPLLLVVSALSSVLFYLNIIPPIIKGFSWLLRYTMGIGGVEGFAAAANVFMGMVESPLLTRPYLTHISRSELFTIMVSGMATISGTVMFLYASILRNVIPGIMGHLLTASIISAPAAITIAKIIVPETSQPLKEDLKIPKQANSIMDAITKGTLEGVNLLINIVAMLIVFVALVHLINIILHQLPCIGGKPLSFQRIVSYIMSPITWIMGISWPEAKIAGYLMGTKTVLNEFIAYLDMAKIAKNVFSPRSKIIMIYAMCGFANFGSLGIMIGGLGTIVPERRDEIISLGIKSIIGGTIATCMTGAIAGILL